ncbi:MAG TPA: LysR family transcriptional regulator [Chloroflexota bacterium]|nr:LysR family transcriptional regulator [Chloroflexota bacterium]
MHTLQQLRAFVTLARHERYGPAADELGISQSTLSAQIIALERSLGLTLCEQLGGRTRLTSVGAELLVEARETIRLMDEAYLAMQERVDPLLLHTAPVRMAADTTVGIYVLPRALGDLRRAHPRIEIQLEIVNRAQVIARLASGETDLVVLGQPPELDGLAVEPYLAHQLVVFAAPTHPLAGAGRISLDRFAAEALVVREPGSGTRRIVETLFGAAGLSPRIALELGHNGAVKAAVAAGLGVGVISSIALERELRLGRLVLLDVEGFPVRRTWHIVRQQQRRLSAAAALVLAFLCEQRAQHTAVPPQSPT